MFLLISVVWHGLQLVAFTWIFRVEAPANPQGQARRLAVQVLGVGPSIPGQTLVERPLGNGPGLSLREVPLAEATTPVPAYVMAMPKILSMERSGPTEKKSASSPNNIPRSFEGSLSSVKVSSGGSPPFLFKGELKSRRVISAPSLPKYPEWALSAAVELNLKVNLAVDANGQPHRVFIDESSGDSQTDMAVLHYVEKMRFEASLAPSVGTMEWSFLLQH